MGVKELRQAGYKVRVTHMRRYYRLDSCGRPYVLELAKWQTASPIQCALPKGGSTLVEITTLEGKNIIVTSITSKKLNYCKKNGVRWALSKVKLEQSTNVQV